MYQQRSQACAVAVFLTVTSTALVSVQQPARSAEMTGELVYNFTYSANQSITARDSNSSETQDATGNLVGGSNGMSHYGGSLTDKGKITVKVTGKQPDGGLIVSISEQGENTRKAPPATCVIYGNTSVICDPNKTIYTEEYTLLRFLGANFVDPNQLDASKHWRIGPRSSMGETVQADYSITSNSNGNMQIGESRKVVQSGSGKLETDIQTKIGYDFNRTVPTSVDEYATQRTDAGVSGNSTTTYQTTLSLITDSVATKP
jgi:hypothetical protein